MIQPFTRRVLDGFSRLYGVVGQVGRVNALDVSPPTLVHDVSREAVQAGGFLAHASFTLTTDGAGGNVYGSLTRASFLAQSEQAAQLREAGLEPNGVDVWILGYSAYAQTANIANFNRLRMGVNLGTLTGGGVSIMLKKFAAAEIPMISGGVTVLRDDLSLDESVVRYKLPIFVPDDTTSAFLGVGTDGGAALELYPFWHCWVGPKGCPPPV